jgi:hypothetical protein
VFRRNQRAAPVPVSEQEMEESVQTFQKRRRFVMIGSVTVMIVAIFVLVALGAAAWFDRDGSMWLFAAICAVLFMIAFRWAWYSPTAEFAGRAPIGIERSRAEVQRTLLSDWTYTQLFGFAAFGLLIAVLKARSWPLTTINDWVYLTLGLFIAGMVFWGVFRKWRFEREDS